MNIEDFCFMWRGKKTRALTPEHGNLLSAIDIRRKSKKNALLLLHGFSSSPAVYRELVPKLAMYDAVTCPLLPGHGKNLTYFAKIQAKEWLTAAEEAYILLQQEYNTVDIMGLSLGGLLACHLSTKFSVNHLYLLAPALALRLKIPAPHKVARALKSLGLTHFRNLAGNLYTSNKEELAYCKLPISSVIEILTMIAEFKFTPPPCPVDLFLGCHDAVVHTAVVARHFATLPNTTIHWLQNSAHLIPLDGDIDIVLKILRKAS